VYTESSVSEKTTLLSNLVNRSQDACSRLLLYHGGTNPKRRRKQMQESRGEEFLRSLDMYEQIVHAFAEQSKAYWKIWGPMGEPMLNGVEYWEAMQGEFMRWLRQNRGAGRQP
jgi:hypothetical protein